jgi:hypothetical protein
MPALPQSNVHLDILMGRDETIEPADIFGGELNVLTSSLVLMCSQEWRIRPPRIFTGTWRRNSNCKSLYASDPFIFFLD